MFNSVSRKSQGDYGVDIVIALWLLWVYAVGLHALYRSEKSEDESTDPYIIGPVGGVQHAAFGERVK
jgi:hypothetical protein